MLQTNGISESVWCSQKLLHTHTHTHTHIYIACVIHP